MKSVFVHKIFIIIIAVVINSCDKEVSITSPEGSPKNTGVIYLTSSPEGAKIYINGKISGEITPDTVKWLEEGKYVVTLKMDLFKDTSFVLSVQRDSVTAKSINYFASSQMHGSIYCDSNPISAEILLNDSSTGLFTPTTIENLMPGYYNITYKRLGNWDYHVTIPVESNKKTYSFVTLEDTSTWITFNNTNSELTTDYLRCIAIENNSVKWIGSIGGGLFRFDDKSWVNYNVDNSGLPSNNINSIIVDEQGRKWICTQAGLTIFDGSNWTVYNTSNSGLPSDQISDIAIDQDGKKWIGTAGKGLVVFDGINWTVYDNTIPGFPNNSITSVTYKKDSSIWVGTNGGGVVKYNGTTFKVYNVKNTKLTEQTSGFPTDNIGTITVLEDTIVWIGFGFDLGSPGGTSYLKYRFWTKKVGLPSADVVSIAGDSNNLVWIGNYFTGLSKYDYTTWVTYNTSNSKIGSNNINDVVVDGNNIKWLATLNGLVKYKGN